MIGSLGDVVFEVSSEKVKTFQDLSFSRSAKFAQHDVHGGKSLLEFTGLDPVTGSMKILLNSALGVDPKEELTTLREIVDKGKAVPFILDGEPQGENLWVVDSLKEDFSRLNNKGVLIAALVSVSLKEYVEDRDDRI